MRRDPDAKGFEKPVAKLPPMTLRDYFASKALEGFAANAALPEVMDRLGGEDHPIHVAAFAYRWADAMLKVREKVGGQS